MPFDMPAKGSWEIRGGWVVRRLAADFGLTMFQSGGGVGNLGFESVGFTKLQEISPLVSGSQGGFGWPQWTGQRRRAFEAFCVKIHLPVVSDEANYSFLVAELRTTFQNTITGLKRATDLAGAVFSFGQTYERPYGTTATHLPGMDGRLGWARRALAGAGEAALAVDSVPSAAPLHPILQLTYPLTVGPTVRDLQEHLEAHGIDVGTADMIFGPRTEAAVKMFQKTNRLGVDGIVGPQTWVKLLA